MYVGIFKNKFWGVSPHTHMVLNITHPVFGRLSGDAECMANRDITSNCQDTSANQNPEGTLSEMAHQRQQRSTRGSHMCGVTMKYDNESVPPRYGFPVHTVTVKQFSENLHPFQKAGFSQPKNQFACG